MGKNKMIAKSCPKCDLQVAVASKTCKCGHTFFTTRKSFDIPSPQEEVRRRTGRVRREKPQFYDSQDYQKQKRKSPKKRSLSRGSDEDYKKDKESAARARRRRALRRAALEREAVANAAERAPRALTPQLRPPQLVRCSIILREINRRIAAVNWKPPPT